MSASDYARALSTQSDKVKIQIAKTKMVMSNEMTEQSENRALALDFQWTHLGRVVRPVVLENGVSGV